ncbi:MAG: amidohydrolase [Clostridia bacterium]|nr:amidohydrolase [Clostridia bacterium]
MDFEIIDFHTHPYKTNAECICVHQPAIKISPDETIKVMDENGVSIFCGSVTTHDFPKSVEETWKLFKILNEDALYLRDYYRGRYVPGIHVHPSFVEESIKEIDKYCEKGVNLIGELIPWCYFFNNTYCSDGMNEILDYASQKGMVLSAHPTSDDDMDKLCQNHPNLIIVGAHPGEHTAFYRHAERAKKNKNYYVDLSGGGIHRYGATRELIDLIGAEKVIFGSDYAICNLQSYVDGVVRDRLLSNEEKRLILAENAKRILKLN